jgi:hypothetical protein
MESLTYAKLRKLCKRRGVSPCSGKGVTKDVLLKKLIEIDYVNKYEQLVKGRDFDQYELIKPYMNSIPDLRQFKTVIARESLQPWDSWKAIWEDLQTLDESEARGSKLEQEFLDTIEADDSYDCDYISEDINTYKDTIKYFFETYPTLSYILGRIYPVVLVFALLSDNFAIFVDITQHPHMLLNIRHIVGFEQVMKLGKFLFPNDNMTYTHAIESNNMEIFKFMHGIRFEITEDDITLAVSTDDPKWIKQLNVDKDEFRIPLTPSHINLAFDRGNIEVIRQILHANIVYDDRVRHYVIGMAAEHANYQIVWPLWRLFAIDINNASFWHVALNETPDSGKLKLLLSLGGNANINHPVAYGLTSPLINLIRKQPVMVSVGPESGDMPLKSVTDKIDLLVQGGANLEIRCNGSTLLNTAENHILYFHYLVDNFQFTKTTKGIYYKYASNPIAKTYLRKHAKRDEPISG